MKSIAIFLLVLTCACGSKKETLSDEQLIDKISAPLIASDVVDLRHAASIFTNPAKEPATRRQAQKVLIDRFPEYMAQAQSYIKDTAEFNKHLALQIAFIEKKYKGYAQELVEKEKLKREYDQK